MKEFWRKCPAYQSSMDTIQGDRLHASRSRSWSLSNTQSLPFVALLKGSNYLTPYIQSHTPATSCRVSSPLARRPGIQWRRVRCVHGRGVISTGITAAGTRHTLASMCVMEDRVNISIVGGLDRRSSVLVQSESLWHNNNRNCRLLVYTAGLIKDFRSPFFVRY